MCLSPGLCLGPHRGASSAPSWQTLGLTIAEGPTELRAPGPRDPTIRHWSCLLTPIHHVCWLLFIMSADSYSSCLLTPVHHVCWLLFVMSADSYSSCLLTPIHHVCWLLFIMSADSCSSCLLTPVHHVCWLLFIMCAADSCSPCQLTPIHHVCWLLFIMSADSCSSCLPTPIHHVCWLLFIMSADSYSSCLLTPVHHVCWLLFIMSADSYSSWSSSSYQPLHHLCRLFSQLQLCRFLHSFDPSVSLPWLLSCPFSSHRNSILFCHDWFGAIQVLCDFFSQVLIPPSARDAFFLEIRHIPTHPHCVICNTRMAPSSENYGATYCNL